MRRMDCSLSAVESHRRKGGATGEASHMASTFGLTVDCGGPALRPNLRGHLYCPAGAYVSIHPYGRPGSSSVRA
jgi:hypothetical protein